MVTTVTTMSNKKLITLVLPSPWEYENSPHLASTISIHTLLQNFKVVKKDAPTPTRKGGSSGMRIEVVSNSHMPLWRSIRSIEESWLFSVDIRNSEEHDLSNEAFFLNHKDRITNPDRMGWGNISQSQFYMMKRCPHNVVHASTLCILGVPMINYGQRKAGCCRHEKCEKIIVETVNTDNGVPIIISPCAETLVLPTCQYLPQFVLGNVKFQLKPLNRGLVVLEGVKPGPGALWTSDLHHHCNQVCTIKGSNRFPQTERSVKFCKTLHDPKMKDLLELAPDFATALAHFDQEKNYINAFFFQNFQDASLMAVVAYLASHRHITFLPIPYPTNVGQYRTCLKLSYHRKRYKDWSVVNVPGLHVSLWPSGECKYHGVHLPSMTDLFFSHKFFAQSTIYPEVVTTNIKWKGDAYNFLLQRNYWAFETGLVPPVNVKIASQQIEWNYSNRCYSFSKECSCHIRDFGMYASHQQFNVLCASSESEEQLLRRIASLSSKPLLLHLKLDGNRPLSCSVIEQILDRSFFKLTAKCLDAPFRVCINKMDERGAEEEYWNHQTNCKCQNTFSTEEPVLVSKLIAWAASIIDLEHEENSRH